MSRVSLSRRIDRIKDHLLQPGSLEHALEHLSGDMRAQWLIWRERADRIIRRTENRGCNPYDEMIADPSTIPAMPRTVETALWPEMVTVRAESDPAVAYGLLLEMQRSQ